MCRRCLVCSFISTSSSASRPSATRDCTREATDTFCLRRLDWAEARLLDWLASRALLLLAPAGDARAWLLAALSSTRLLPAIPGVAELPPRRCEEVLVPRADTAVVSCALKEGSPRSLALRG